MDFKVGDRVRICFPEDMRPLRWDSVRGLMDARTGTIVGCVSGFWVVRFDQPIEIVPGSYAQQLYEPEIEQEPLPAAWLRRMADVGGLFLGAGNRHGLATGHFADRAPVRPPEPYTPMPARS
jgi:hypothetical protein